MPKFIRFTLLWGLLAVHADAVDAGSLTLKLATVAPKDSVWHQHLKEVGQRWRDTSQGAVSLKIYAGTLGDEDAILRRVRVGQLDAAAISTSGLSAIDPSTRALHIPLAFSSDAELAYVQSVIGRELEPRLLERGFRVLMWAEVGWVHFFSSEPVVTPDDLRRLKLFVWSSGGADAGESLWQDMGFDTISLTSVDILPALQTGMIDAFGSPPIMALANQWFPFTPYMTDLEWAPLVGAIVVSERSWRKVPAEYRDDFIEIMREQGERLRAATRELDRQARTAMIERGLQVVPVPAASREQWNRLARQGYPAIRGSLVPEPVFDRVIELRDEFRARPGATP